jgi:hypothetical protein
MTLMKLINTGSGKGTQFRCSAVAVTADSMLLMDPGAEMSKAKN